MRATIEFDARTVTIEIEQDVTLYRATLRDEGGDWLGEVNSAEQGAALVEAVRMALDED